MLISEILAANYNSTMLGKNCLATYIFLKTIHEEGDQLAE